jgi:hypothetical protein
MKHTRLIVLSGVLVLILVAVCVLAATQAQWKVVVPKTNVGDKVRMAAFFDNSFGVWGGAGDPGKAHYTLDGGKTWATADSSGG